MDTEQTEPVPERIKAEHFDMLQFALKRTQHANSGLQVVADFLATTYNITPADKFDLEHGLITRAKSE